MKFTTIYQILHCYIYFYLQCILYYRPLEVRIADIIINKVLYGTLIWRHFILAIGKFEIEITIVKTINH